MSITGILSLIGYFKLQALQLRLSSLVLNSRSPLHFGQTRISNNSLSIAIKPLHFNLNITFLVGSNRFKNFVYSHLLHTFVGSQRALSFPAETAVQLFIYRYVIQPVSPISHRIGRSKHRYSRNAQCCAKMERSRITTYQ